MPYVMMPVPEEHVEEVMQFILRAMARASIQSWDEPSIADIYHRVDEASRSLLAFVARASVDGEELAATDAARRIQLTPREALGIVNELNGVTREENRPNLINARSVTERLPNGRTTEKRVFQMEPDVAELVRQAEEAELADAQHPLGEPSS
jgi:hypothetical protein